MAYDRQKIQQAWDAISTDLNLAPLPLPNLHYFDRLKSTNQTLWQLLKENAPEGTAITALQQTAGRGQWGRSWSSEPGGLYLSWAIAPNLPLEKALLLTISSAWGIATILREYSRENRDEKPQLPIQIKWPNDLILHQRKLGGILTETRIQQGRIRQVVIGVGINWSNHVPESAIALQKVLETEKMKKIASLEQLLALTLRGLISGYQAIAENKEATAIAGYNQLLTHIGQPIPFQGQTGIIRGITETGQLQIDLNSSPPIVLNPGQITLGYGQTL